MVAMTTLASPTLDLLESQHSDSTIRQLIIAMDICGPFPTSERGKKYILVAADYFTKWPECWAIADQEAKTVAHCLEELICRHGVPQVLLTDQGRNFESQVIAEVCDLLHITKKRMTAYHPQCDGKWRDSIELWPTCLQLM